MFGLNSGQVEAYVRGLENLDERAWDKVVAADRVGKAAFGGIDWLQVESMSGDRRSDVERAQRAAIARLPRTPEGKRRLDVLGCAIGAATVLTLPDVVTWGWFASGYAPFLDVLPLASLGDGLAPGVPVPADSRFGRFGTRLRALTDPPWGNALLVARMRNDAVPLDLLHAAQDAATRALDRVYETRGTELHAAIDDVEMACAPTGSSAGTRRVWELMFKRVGKSEFEAATHWADRWADDEVAAHAIAADALAAVAASDIAPWPECALMYLPFAAVIPLNSLEVERL